MLGVNSTDTESGLTAFLGAGFEAFLFGLDSLSLEINSGLLIYSESDSSSGGRSGIQLGSSENIFPFNLGLHYYF